MSISIPIEKYCLSHQEVVCRSLYNLLKYCAWSVMCECSNSPASPAYVAFPLVYVCMAPVLCCGGQVRWQAYFAPPTLFSDWPHSSLMNSDVGISDNKPSRGTRLSTRRT